MLKRFFSEVSPFKPLSNRVLVRIGETESNRTKGGIYIPDTASKDDGKKVGVICSVGSGYVDGEGKKHPVNPELKPGRKVILSKYADDDIEFEERLTRLWLKPTVSQ